MAPSCSTSWGTMMSAMDWSFLLTDMSWMQKLRLLHLFHNCLIMTFARVVWGKSSPKGSYLGVSYTTDQCLYTSMSDSQFQLRPKLDSGMSDLCWVSQSSRLSALDSDGKWFRILGHCRLIVVSQIQVWIVFLSVWQPDFWQPQVCTDSGGNCRHKNVSPLRTSRLHM